MINSKCESCNYKAHNQISSYKILIICDKTGNLIGTKYINRDNNRIINIQTDFKLNGCSKYK